VYNGRYQKSLFVSHTHGTNPPRNTELFGRSRPLSRHSRRSARIEAPPQQQHEQAAGSCTAACQPGQSDDDDLGGDPVPPKLFLAPAKAGGASPWPEDVVGDAGAPSSSGSPSGGRASGRRMRRRQSKGRERAAYLTNALVRHVWWYLVIYEWITTSLSI
jgi:hypothetical protein